ncbi:MAG: sigma-54-dependent Fis family transcriptional regulator [Hyphomicrobiales bacterium]|nr:sigma-54-dependent Fis family transcriptional regulator [Hyphomicrobiales bacterium]
MNPTVYLIDDEDHLRTALAQSLELAGLDVAAFSNGREALAAIGEDANGVVVSDILMAGLSGLQVFEQLQAADPDLPVILMTGHGDVPMAVKAIRAGAYDFIEKPFAPDRLIETVRRAMEKRGLVLEVRRLRRSLDAIDDLDAVIVGRSSGVVRLREHLLAFAQADADVLIYGETGTGKELVARSLHERSPRRAGNFVSINCGALPESVIESEFFGHEAGAFTGASKTRVGKFEYANGGTVFLDEIESMPRDMQIRLLRVLQERTIVRLGSNREIPVDVRIIAATKEDLAVASAEGRFRQDLYYRLDVLKLEIPPLRERAGDVPLLFVHFVDQAAARLNRTAPPLSPSQATSLQQRDWPGNVRELQNAALRFAMGLDTDIIAASGRDTMAAARLQRPLAAQTADFERQVIAATLEANGGSLKATYEALGISRKTLYDKIQRYGLSVDEAGGA